MHTLLGFDLNQQNFVAAPGNITPTFNETTFNTSLPNGAVVIIHLLVVTQESVFSFANQTLQV
jgi:hypothetical protein